MTCIVCGARLDNREPAGGRRSMLHDRCAASLSEAVLASLRAGRQAGSPSRLHAPLTPAERRVLRRLVEGDSNLQIARRLCISQKTVKNHVSAILATLDVGSRTEAAVATLRGRLLDDE